MKKINNPTVLPRLNVLIIDDEEQICELVENFLMGSKYFERLVTASSAFQATQKMQNQKFDLVIVDFYMQGKNGIDFIKDMRKSMKNKDVKVLLISGDLQEENVLFALRSHIKNILIKPFSRRQLLGEIYRIFQLRPETMLLTSLDVSDDGKTIDFDFDFDIELSKKNEC